MLRYRLVATVLCLLLAGCNLPVYPTAEPTATISNLPIPVELEVLPPTLAVTPSPQPHTVTSTPTQTLTPTNTATPPHPMDIQAMRAAVFPGSDITIVEELERGSNYRRFYSYYLSEGLKIYALLAVPEGESPAGGWPVIVFNHGYIPPDQYRTTQRYVAYVDWLARSGYIVFRIDYRGHDQSEGEAAGAYGDPGYTVDVLNAVASLQRFPGANPDKVGMWGHSMGGFLTLRAMVISPHVRAGVIWAGVVSSYPDMLNRWRRPGVTPTPSNRRRWRSDWLEAYGSPETNPEFWSAISANTFLADLSGPIQLHHGTMDESVPLEFSEQLALQIQEAGGVVELYTYTGDNHNLSTYFTQAMTRTVAFFDAYLK